MQGKKGNSDIPKKQIIKLIPLMPKDSDIFRLNEMHKTPSIGKYISISDNYFNYVTSTNGVTYYKIYCDNELAGGIHTEKADGTMYLSICIDEKWRRKGIAAAALNQLFLTKTDGVNIIEVSIDDNNFPSIALFERLGFTRTGNEEELITLRKVLH